MCGICGVVYHEPSRPVSRDVVEAMCRSIAHRGPDDQGTHVNANVGIGNRRLSIIDLEGGAQPVHNEDKTVWAVFNGEIYNYAELMELLKRRGHQFRSHCDSEVIVHAYEEFGDEFLDHLNGMFAIAIWDTKQQRLLLARDRTGIKPLYYTMHDGGLVFGSELKAVLTYPGMPRNIDLSALNEYLSFEYVPTPRTIFQNISKLPPGHLLVLKNGETTIKQYWDVNLARSEGVQPKRLDQYESEFDEIFRDVIEKEMVSDVPVAALLSGGIDSSAVAAYMAKIAPGRVKSFSIGFEDASFDESAYARQVAEFIGTEHYELKLTPSMTLDLLPKIATFMDEPLGDSSLVPTFLLSQFTSGYVKAALGGDGGDEIFAGYSTLQAHKLVQYYETLVPGPVRTRLIPWIVDRLPVSYNNLSLDFKLRRFIDGRGLTDIVRHHRWLGSFTPSQKAELVQPWARLQEKDTYDVAYHHLHRCRAKSSTNQILYADMKLYMEGDILPKVDRASMANSLEVRVPFLNHTLVEYLATVPEEMKLHGMTTKFLLRRGLRGKVPDNILKRGKKGFNMPVAKWLTGPLRPLVEDYFSETRLKNDGFFDPKYARSLVDEHMSGRADHRKLLWTLLSFQMWHDNWATAPTPGSTTESIQLSTGQ
ncbi:MAG: asparagine synthase (glutamine-hydrolyzing) [Kiritimatiellae bacterium]|nr:asparagine synthase (glutamine-hydrolyzing) [Kiritimatiellia bacterium]